MINFVDTYSLKHKFASFLSKSYFSAGLTLEQINNVMVFDKRLFFMETNNYKWFIDKQIEELDAELFGSDLFFYSNDANPVYWAGLQYMTISLNCSIPLNQIFLLCPLDKMVSLYEAFHEMSSQHIIERFLENEYKNSVLKAIREYRNMSLKELSLLSSIPYDSLKYYEKTNNTLFSASSSNISSLSNALGVESSLFLKKSSFVPFSLSLLDDQLFVNKISKQLSSYLSIKDLQIQKILNQDEQNPIEGYLYIGSINVLYINNKNIYIDDLPLISLIKISIQECLTQNNNQLYF